MTLKMQNLELRLASILHKIVIFSWNWKYAQRFLVKCSLRAISKEMDDDANRPHSTEFDILL